MTGRFPAVAGRPHLARLAGLASSAYVPPTTSKPAGNTRSRTSRCLVPSRDRDRPTGSLPRFPTAPISADLFIPNERWYPLRDPGPLADGEGATDEFLWAAPLHVVLTRNDAERGNEMLDLTPATGRLIRLVTDIGDDQLDARTPCRGATVADLLDHLDGLCLAFTAAAAKDPTAGSQAPSADGSRLEPDWRMRISDRLAHLASAWQDETAWAGMTRAGGLDMPGDVAGHVAINEVVVHGWDIAAATGHDYACETELIRAAYAFVQSAVAQNPDGTPGLFGPPVSVPDSAPLLDRLIALTGRDPAWQPAGEN